VAWAAAVAWLTACAAAPAPCAPSPRRAPAIAAAEAQPAPPAPPTPPPLEPAARPREPPARAAPAAPRQISIERVATSSGELLVVPGGSHVLLYLHGRCGDPEAFRAFAPAVPEDVTLISVRSDVKCKSSPRTKWSMFAPRIDELMRAAVAAVSSRRSAPLDDKGWLVFGYSEGALRAESLLTRYPDRYVAGVLAGGPRAPRKGSLGSARRVALLAGSLDARNHLIAAADELRARGVDARFTLLPGARHGQYGPEGEAVVGETLEWVLGAIRAERPFIAAPSAFQN
jgi:predicted esterase